MPVFTDLDHSNRLFVQKIAAGDVVERFEPIEIGDHSVTVYPEVIRVGPGERALWGFQFSSDTCVIGTREALHSQLYAIESELPPILRLQMARVFDEPGLDERIAAAHDFLQSMSTTTASLWRDLVILLPQVRNALLTALVRPSAAMRAAIDAIDLRTTGDRLTVEAFPSLIDSLGGDEGAAAALLPLTQLFAALRIAEVTVNPRDASPPEDYEPQGKRAKRLTVIPIGSTVLSGALAARSNAISCVTVDRILDTRGKVIREQVPLLSEAVLLVVEDKPEYLAAATALSASLASKRPYLGTIIVRGGRAEEELAPDAEPDNVEKRFYSISRTSRWLAVTGTFSRGAFATVRNIRARPTANTSPSHLTKWTALALAACLDAGETGREAIRILHVRARGAKFAVIASASADGPDAAQIAAQAALDATAFTTCPASQARELLLVAFHSGTKHSTVRDQLLAVAKRANEKATVRVVESARPGMKNRARIVTMARGRRPSGSARIPRDYLLRLFQFGWSVDEALFDEELLERMVVKGSRRFALRVEPDLILDEVAAEEIVRSTPMHYREVALLTKEMPAPAIRERLLTSAIFCATVTEPESLADYGDRPFATMLDALAKLDRGTICERVASFIAGYALTGLWYLWSPEPGVTVRLYDRWTEGIYRTRATLDQLRLHRIASDGTLYFDGVVRLDATVKEAAPSLVSRFGVALDRNGPRATRPLVAVTQ